MRTYVNTNNSFWVYALSLSVVFNMAQYDMELVKGFTFPTIKQPTIKNVENLIITPEDLNIAKDAPMIVEAETIEPISVWTNKACELYLDMDYETPMDTLYEGAELEATQIDETWYKASGYYLNIEDISFDKVDKNLNMTNWTTAIIDLMEEPNEDVEIIDTLDKGSEVIVNDILDGWSKITVNGETGYVSNQYLSNEFIPQEIFLGNYTITYYCNCSICCGEYAGLGKTASGAKVQAGTTIAVDTNKIPFGTEIIIDGHTYIAQDKGGSVKGNHIDIYCDTHEEALSYGKHTSAVYMVLNEAT
jgi:3D (Asp-Asp-Asp) domain-containing protein